MVYVEKPVPRKHSETLLDALIVTPAEAGVQKSFRMLDSRFRGNDSKEE
jgi:hypothetical protein